MGGLMYRKPIVVAEIGNTHIGSLERAKKLAAMAAECGADYLKTQKRSPTESVPKDLQNKPHPNPYYSYGDTYLEHRNNLELNIEEHAVLKEYCVSLGIGYSSSVWDLTSAKEIISLEPDYIKIPSACNLNWDLLKYVYGKYDGMVHISLGMITQDEKQSLIDKIYNYFFRTVLYHCVSSYPCEFSDLCLLEIKKMHEKYQNRENYDTGELDPTILNGIGFSNHARGIHTDVCAYTLGSQWIERHFIDDRTFRHSDSSSSLEMQGLSKLVRNLNNVYLSLTYKENLSEDERKQRKKLQFRG